MAVPIEQALYPARAGAQAKLRILFTAPQAAGTYQSSWQAIAPDGTAFGAVVSIQITISP
jgi:methionine-rich copper-binding protein CopC